MPEYDPGRACVSVSQLARACTSTTDHHRIKISGVATQARNCSSSCFSWLQFFLPPSVHPSPSLPLFVFPSVSYCLARRTHLCTINLPTNELEPLTLSLPLSAADVPYLCAIFLPLFLAQPFYCSIDRHVISYMNNARQAETKIVALLLSLGWDLFCNSLTECARVDFYSAARATLLKGIGIWMQRYWLLPKLRSY